MSYNMRYNNGRATANRVKEEGMSVLKITTVGNSVGVILPKEIRRGAYALELVFAGREAAKMRPSEDRCC